MEKIELWILRLLFWAVVILVPWAVHAIFGAWPATAAVAAVEALVIAAYVFD